MKYYWIYPYKNTQECLYVQIDIEKVYSMMIHITVVYVGGAGLWGRGHFFHYHVCNKPCPMG